MFFTAGVLTSTEDFETSDDVYEAIGSLLADAVGAEKDAEIRYAKILWLVRK